MKHRLALLVLVTLLVPTPRTVRADEGMWLFEKLPVERIRRSTGVQLTDAWIEHVRKASLRFGSGGSGAFVGPNGLAITNHHIIDGDAGSPVVNIEARFVGVIFDGHRYSASWGSVYDNDRGRAVSVDARAIAAALRNVYGAEFLVEQLK